MFVLKGHCVPMQLMCPCIERSSPALSHMQGYPSSSHARNKCGRVSEFTCFVKFPRLPKLSKWPKHKFHTLQSQKRHTMRHKSFKPFVMWFVWGIWTMALLAGHDPSSCLHNLLSKSMRAYSNTAAHSKFTSESEESRKSQIFIIFTFFAKRKKTN